MFRKMISILLLYTVIVQTEAKTECLRKPLYSLERRNEKRLGAKQKTPFFGINFARYNPKSAQLTVHEIVNLSDVNTITSGKIDELKQQILKHGVVKIPNQKMTHKQQMEFSQKIGKVLLIPESFKGKHKIFGFPHISPVCNYWNNGTWKGETHRYGQYWHKDVNFQTFEKGYVLSMLYAGEFEEGAIGGETAFIDGCNLKKRLSPDMEKHFRNKKQSISVYDIPDFVKRASKEELDLFPAVNHNIIFKHPGKDEECIFGRLLVPPYGDDLFTNAFLRMWDFMQDPRFVMKQHWKTGDIILWDNYGVFHRAMPLLETRKKRLLYRTLIQLKVNMDEYRKDSV